MKLSVDAREKLFSGKEILELIFVFKLSANLSGSAIWQ